MKADGKLIDALIRSELFQNYQRAFNEATGMPLTLRPVETWQLPFHGKRKENAFCALMAGKSHTCAACLRMQEKLAHDAMNTPSTTTCIYGLCETAAPVKIGPQTIGFLQTGQVMRRKPTAAAFQRAIDEAWKLGEGIDNERTKQAFFGTLVVSQSRLKSVSALLGIFAEHLAIKSNQFMVQAVNVDSPIIARAKQFIRDHSAEKLSLRSVSSAMNISVFYFCKQFRKGTGLKFTEFLARTRVELAKNRLLNRNLRVSEIAYEAGFQSLTHFNRVFKQVAGQSPTDYRVKLLAKQPNSAGPPSLNRNQDISGTE
ncbi:MAG TPA: helix-turn-helix domain-containing protein [Verrucomicrobiae bacterium]|nr:helix-turn-helix domain-containing protein [Verrucomicrobiae bacterium]